MYTEIKPIMNTIKAKGKTIKIGDEVILFNGLYRYVGHNGESYYYLAPVQVDLKDTESCRVLELNIYEIEDMIESHEMMLAKDKR